MNSTEWKNVIVDFPDHISTMISAEEKKYLYWLGESAWQGKGLVVEIGPWLGGSTWRLAAGMQASGHGTNKRLVVYGNFIWCKFMSERAPLDLKPGECFLAGFLANISMYESIVDSYKQTLPDEVITNDWDAQSKRYVSDEDVTTFQGLPGSDPLEILFVDGAKSWLGLKHLLLNVSDRLIPNHSILVCQDFKYWGNYWVPLLLTLLSDYLQPVHNVISATTVTFRLIHPISRNNFINLANHIADMPTNDALAAIDRAAMMLHTNGDDLGAANVQLGKVMLLSHQNKLDWAVTAFRESQANWPRFMETAQLERARKYLAESRSIYISPSQNRRVIQVPLRVLKVITRVVKTITRSLKGG